MGPVKEVTTMKAKQVYLTGKERLIVETLVSLEIQSNKRCKEMSIDLAFETKTLESIYEKITGFKWKEDT